MDNRQKYNLKYAKEKMKKDRMLNKDMISIYKKQIKELENGLKFLNFETELFENYSNDYCYNESLKDDMLKNYSCLKHFNHLLDRTRKDLNRCEIICNKSLEDYIDLNNYDLKIA